MDPIAEDRLAESTGLARERLRDLRKAAPAGLEFPKLNGGKIHWTAEGVQWLEKKIGLTGSEDGDTTLESSEMEKLHIVEILAVHRRNKRWMQGQKKNSGRAERVTVQVKDNSLFIPGMRLPCVAKPGHPGVYTYQGPRPTRRGVIHAAQLERYTAQVERGDA